MNTVSFDDYNSGKYDGECLIDLDTCPPRMRSDYHTRNENVEAGRELCSECGGTGNEFYSTYRKCPKCNGDGAVRSI